MYAYRSGAVTEPPGLEAEAEHRLGQKEKSGERRALRELINQSIAETKSKFLKQSKREY